jgi:NADH-quinone oxidoreductase subunit M
MEFVHPLTLVTFFPLIGVLILLLTPAEQKNLQRWTALLTSLITFGISIWVLTLFNASNPDLQLVARHDWITVAGWNIRYYLGLDGLSILLLLLTTFITPISILSTWTAVEERVKEFMLFFLLLEVGMVGVFLAQDLFLFYIFWEFTLVPMYFLIGIWGATGHFVVGYQPGHIFRTRVDRQRRNPGEYPDVALYCLCGGFRDQGPDVAAAFLVT